MITNPQKIAGHTFAGFRDDVCTALKSDGTVCGKAWLKIKHCRTDEYVDKPDIAHIGKTNEQEISEIAARAQAEDDAEERAMAAMRALAAP